MSKIKEPTKRKFISMSEDTYNKLIWLRTKSKGITGTKLVQRLIEREFDALKQISIPMDTNWIRTKVQEAEKQRIRVDTDWIVRTEEKARVMYNRSQKTD